MGGAIKAIETRYKGYRFRSRLEARWAVFFDGVGLDWQYEPEGYDLGEYGWYLPDFFLPSLSLWVEIKPLHTASGNEQEKMCGLVGVTGCNGTIFKGDPYDTCLPDPHFRPGVDDWSSSALYQNGGQGPGAYDCPYCFCVCPTCQRVGFEYDGRGARVCDFKGHAETWDPFDDFAYGARGHGDKGYSYNHPIIINAAIKARSARFEHGEVPA